MWLIVRKLEYKSSDEFQVCGWCGSRDEAQAQLTFLDESYSIMTTDELIALCLGPHTAVRRLK